MIIASSDGSVLNPFKFLPVKDFWKRLVACKESMRCMAGVNGKMSCGIPRTGGAAPMECGAALAEGGLAPSKSGVANGSLTTVRCDLSAAEGGLPLGNGAVSPLEGGGKGGGKEKPPTEWPINTDETKSVVSNPRSL